MLKHLFKFFLNFLPRPFLIRLSYTIRPFLAFFLKGTNFTDPIDGKSFKTFLPYGYGAQRNNALSPSTLSLERHRLLWLYLNNETNFFTDYHKVLHFAPEQAFYKRFRNMKNLDYITTDLNSPLADVKSDICHLPFKDNEFDVILCNHVLEHIPDYQSALREIERVLKPGGKLLVLEFSKVAKPLEKAYDWYSFNVLPKLGKWVAGDDASYRYLAESIRMHPGQEELKALMKNAGFGHAEFHNLSAGVVALHLGIKC